MNIQCFIVFIYDLKHFRVITQAFSNTLSSFNLIPLNVTCASFIESGLQCSSLQTSASSQLVKTANLWR